MTPRIQLLLSFDHELSLGGTADYERNLFSPTRRLLDAAERNGVPITLFTDVLCPLRFEQWGEHGFVRSFKEQLHDALQRGNDVQLHIHPHWADSRFESGTFIPSRSFALADFGKPDSLMPLEEIISQCFDRLTAWCQAARPEYSCVAFRAGGYNLHPETPRILRSLYEHGIRIDSSIIKDYRFQSTISRVDFSGMPASANWTIPLGGPLNAESGDDAGLYEIPIASMPRTPLNNIPFLLNRVRHRNRAYNSGGHGIHDGTTSRSQKLARLFPRSAWSLSFDDAAHSVNHLMQVLRYHVNRHAGQSLIRCASIGHPKNMGDYALDVFDTFVQRARMEYGTELSFVTYSDVAASRNLGEKRLPQDALRRKNV